MRLVPLGTNGFIPTFGRQTMSFLVLDQEEALLLDAGTGLARLLEPAVGTLVAGRRHLHLFLTHYHLDHVVGLSYLTAVWRDRGLTLHAPTRPLVEVEAEAAIEQLLSPPLFPIRLADFPLAVEVRPYSGEPLEIGGLRLRLRRQTHPGGSVGVRIGDALAYVTDSVVDEDTVGFVRGVGLLLHEVWLTAAEAEAQDAAAIGHSAAPGVARLAREAGVGRLMPVHHHPKRDRQDLERLVAELAASGLAVLLPEEGEVYEI
jgi:ribonuclease BN (tRNA processing enzyme)